MMGVFTLQRSANATSQGFIDYSLIIQTLKNDGEDVNNAVCCILRCYTVTSTKKN